MQSLVVRAALGHRSGFGSHLDLALQLVAELVQSGTVVQKRELLVLEHVVVVDDSLQNALQGAPPHMERGSRATPPPSP